MSNSSLGGNLISSISAFIRRSIILESSVLAASMKAVSYVPFVRLKAASKASAVLLGKMSG